MRKLRRPVQLLKALAPPVLLYLVVDLVKEEKSACELANQICCDVSTLSRHLSQLRNAGIAEDEKLGFQVFYRLPPYIIGFIACLGNVSLKHLISSQRCHEHRDRLHHGMELLRGGVPEPHKHYAGRRRQDPSGRVPSWPRSSIFWKWRNKPFGDY